MNWQLVPTRSLTLVSKCTSRKNSGPGFILCKIRIDLYFCLVYLRSPRPDQYIERNRRDEVLICIPMLLHTNKEKSKKVNKKNDAIDEQRDVCVCK